ncbi:MAG: dicarboxylate/amino acid:cation symporter [Spirochaetales bacterium]|nr:dicarboxylate/amino acid:cation symporter [Spirochaetales bacterium]
MKIWFKYLIAAAVGAIAGIVVPGSDSVVVDAAVGIATNLTRYMLFTVVFFSVAMATWELHEDKRLARVWYRSIAWSAVTVFVSSLVGLAGAFVFSAGRIPLSADPVPSVESLPRVPGVLAMILPPDGVASLISFDFLLPVAVFASVLGLAFAYDRSATKPATLFFDSMSRIAWQVNSFFVELLPLPLLVVAGARMSALAANERLGVFGPLFLALAVEAAFLVLVLLPLALFVLDRSRNPYRVMAALIAPAVAAAVFGHTYASAGTVARVLKESLGVRRRVGAVSLPLVLAFGRAGTAMVTATSFVAILNSYSNLGLGSSTILWMLATVPAAALALGAAPGSGPIVALAALCASYGRGFESGYTLLAPVLLPLTMIAALVDAVCMSVVVAAVASREACLQPKDLRHYI